MPARDIEKLVLLDLKKERVLKRVYGIEVTEAQVEAEVKRIDNNTRAPEILAEVKKALGNESSGDSNWRLTAMVRTT